MSFQSPFNWPQAIYQVLHHPFRRKLLQYMIELDEPTSAVDYVNDRGVEGKTADKATSFVSYHLRQLHAAGMVTFVTSEAVRGANKKIYRISEGFPQTFGDTLALNQIASLLEQNFTGAKAGVLKEVGEIVISTGRSMTPKDESS